MADRCTSHGHAQPAGVRAGTQLIRASASRRYTGRTSPGRGGRRPGGQALGRQRHQWPAAARLSDGPATRTPGTRPAARRSGGPRRPPPAGRRSPRPARPPGPRREHAGRVRRAHRRRGAVAGPRADGRSGRRRPRPAGRPPRRPPGRHQPASAAARARTSRLVTPTTPTPRPWRQALGRGHPDPQPGEQARADVHGHRLEVGQRPRRPARSTWAMAGARDSACRRRPVAQARGAGPVPVGHRHPDQLGGRLDPEHDHRRPAAPAMADPTPRRRAQRVPPPPTVIRRASSPPTSASATGSLGARRPPARPGRQDHPERVGPEHRCGHVAPLDQGHRAVLDQLGQGQVVHLGQGAPGGRRRRGAARPPRRRRGSGYWRTRVKVGLVTGPATPRARANPWAKVVLPAPRPPPAAPRHPAGPGPARAAAERPGCRSADGRGQPDRRQGARRPAAAHRPAASRRLARTRSARISATTSPPERRAAAGW